MKILQLVDVHLNHKWLSATDPSGLNLHERDTYRALEAVTAWLPESKAEVLVIGGDLFEHITPTTWARTVAFNLVKKAQELNMFVIVIPGNHDYPRTSTSQTPLLHLEKFFGAHLALDQQFVDHKGVRFHLIPFPTIAAQAEDRETINPIEFAETPNVLVAHSWIRDKNVPGNEVAELPRNIWNDQRFNLVMMGHIHIHKKISNNPPVFYGGPLERQDWGEGDLEPALWLHDLDLKSGKLESESVLTSSLGVEGLPRPLWMKEIAQGEATPDEISRLVLKEMQKVPEGSFGRLIITDCEDLLRTSALPSIWEKAFKKAGGVQIEIKLESKTAAELLGRVDIPDKPARIDQAFRDFLQQEKKSDLIELALEVLAQAEGDKGS